MRQVDILYLPIHLKSPTDPRVGDVVNIRGSKYHADTDGNKRQCANSEIVSPLFVETHGVGFEEEVDEAVDKRHVQGDQL